MNSITPIASITATLEMMLNSITKDNEHSTYHIDPEDIQEFKQALKTIGKRSNGLMHFVNTYRNLTRIPKPNFRIIKVIDIFKEIKSLMLEEIKVQNIEFSCPVYPANLELFADEKLIEQVLINLVKNSIHAVENRDKPKIIMKAYKNKRGRVTIHVIDNGQGILSDVLDKIFIPFFTTKPKGSGIGLSLSREILRLHGGSIYAHSTPERETTFTLSF
jgi:signal transduction histidine kinase